MKSKESTEYYDHHSARLHREWLEQKSPAELSPFLQELKPNSRVLDLGCGSGIDLSAFATAGHRVVGLDQSPKMVDLARALNPGVEIRQKNFLFLDLALGEWDAIWVNGAFNLFAPEIIQRVIAICFKGLATGGTLGIIADEGEGTFEDRSGDLSGPSRQVHLYSEKQLCSMTEQTGFKVDRVGRMTGTILILAKRVG